MVQALLTQTGIAFGSLVVHTCPQVPQLVAVLVLSTHAPLQSDSDPQPDTHE
jgi:hypothetical protein